jgi:hypothetical protein
MKKIKQWPPEVYEYPLFGIKALLAFLAVIFGTLFYFYIYFLIDLITSVYEKYKESEDRDLSIEGFETLKKSSKRLQLDFNKMATDQQKYEKEREVKENALKFLNKLITEGLIREKDLLSFTRASGYFMLFIYSASLNRLAKSLKIERPLRQYPTFLELLGFVRLGKNSTLFLLNKNRLEDKRLKVIKDMKNFLAHHFSRIRKREWNDFLAKVEKINKKEFSKLKSRTYKEWGYLKYNFLLTETNMNPTNIGFVDREYIGLGVATKNEAITSQILERPQEARIEIDKQLKVKIKKIVGKLDISLLLEGTLKEDGDAIDLKQDIIKENLGVENIIDLYKVNVTDLSSALIGIGLTKEKAIKISKRIIGTTTIYRDALTELNITI